MKHEASGKGKTTAPRKSRAETRTQNLDNLSEKKFSDLCAAITFILDVKIHLPVLLKPIDEIGNLHPINQGEGSSQYIDSRTIS